MTSASLSAVIATLVREDRTPPPKPDTMPENETWAATEGCLLCPFCGGFAMLAEFPIGPDGHVLVYRFRFEVRCSACGAKTSRWDTKERAMAKWNRCGRGDVPP